jgi:hypothetical protein
MTPGDLWAALTAAAQAGEGGDERPRRTRPPIGGRALHANLQISEIMWADSAAAVMARMWNIGSGAVIGDRAAE